MQPGLLRALRDGYATLGESVRPGRMLRFALIGFGIAFLVPLVAGIALSVLGHDLDAVVNPTRSAFAEGAEADPGGGLPADPEADAAHATEADPPAAPEDSPAPEPDPDAGVDADGGPGDGAGGLPPTGATLPAEETSARDDVTAEVVGDGASPDGEDAEPAAYDFRVELESGSVPFSWRIQSLFGVLGFLGLAFLMSNNRRRINWRIVAVGLSLQFGFAVFILKTPIGRPIFEAASGAFVKLLSFTNEGSQFLFGSYALGNEIHPSLINFVFAVLPTIIFFSALMTLLYHLGVMQRIVAVVAWAMQRTMGTSGSETTSASANIFVGQTEAPLMVKPFVATMTMSELMAVMTAGFATVAGGVLALYVQFLSPWFPGIAGHLMAASVMAAPGALVIAKIVFPETEDSPTRGGVNIEIDSPDANAIDAAARGAADGLSLALNVAAMLLAFIALIAMFDFLIGIPAYLQHGRALASLLEQTAVAGVALPAEFLERCDIRTLSVAFEDRIVCIQELRATLPEEAAIAARTWPTFGLETMFGYLFFPIALLMGAPIAECVHLGQLLGQKMVVNELYAYLNLSLMIQDPEVTLSPRTVILATYALCGFANFGSIAIQIGGIGSIAPSRRSDLARLGLKAMVAGSLASFMNATIAGIVL
ncbi:MAG: hypothetical protein EA398_13130 [Deltaproteobacteria bacterium]|nr:MAG: hypothetical protein EA398_13130 [Deltaproteobacteria bacterium]